MHRPIFRGSVAQLTLPLMGLFLGCWRATPKIPGFYSPSRFPVPGLGNKTTALFDAVNYNYGVSQWDFSLQNMYSGDTIGVRYTVAKPSPPAPELRDADIVKLLDLSASPSSLEPAREIQQNRNHYIYLVEVADNI